MRVETARSNLSFVATGWVDDFFFLKREALIDQHFMQMNNVGEPYQHAGSLQLFKLHKAIKYVEIKTTRMSH